MLETRTTQRIKTFIPFNVGSGSKRIEDLEETMSNYPLIKGFTFDNLLFDVATHLNIVYLQHLANETFKGGEETIPVEILEHDVYVRMSPVRKYSIKAKITKITKAEPRIVIGAEDIYLAD